MRLGWPGFVVALSFEVCSSSQFHSRFVVLTMPKQRSVLFSSFSFFFYKRLRHLRIHAIKRHLVLFREYTSTSRVRLGYPFIDFASTSGPWRSLQCYRNTYQFASDL